MKECPIVYALNGRIIDDKEKQISNWGELIKDFKEVYIIDLDGLYKNEPNLDLYQKIHKDLWIDAMPRRFEDIMDIVVSGASRVVIRQDLSEEDMNKVFNEIDINVYRIIKEGDSYSLGRLDGFIYMLDREMDFEIEGFLSDFSSIYILSRHKDYIDFDWIKYNGIEGVFYPLWEMTN